MSSPYDRCGGRLLIAIADCSVASDLKFGAAVYCVVVGAATRFDRHVVLPTLPKSRPLLSQELSTSHRSSRDGDLEKRTCHHGERCRDERGETLHVRLLHEDVSAGEKTGSTSGRYLRPKR